GAAGRLRRLAALVSPRLSSAQPRVRLGLYRRISRWRNLAWPCVAPSGRQLIADQFCLSHSRVTNAHHIIPQERLLMLDLFEKSFEHIPRVEQADWPRVLIQDGYV